ncbi:MAG: SET domain-containing protein [Planctomycetaceae bacterium]|nr:SET domain-containing protein [Planctomycetaceae bacterium]
MPIQSSPYIEVKQSPGKGRGVFACKFIPAGTEFEKVPVLVFPSEEVLTGEVGDVLADYVFEWGKGTVALALGFGSIYNHSYSPNARYDDVGRMTKVYTALRDIQPGEEITINYNGHEDATDPVGFEVNEDDKAFAKRNQTNRRRTAQAV